jgi:hypothetical protein
VTLPPLTKDEKVDGGMFYWIRLSAHYRLANYKSVWRTIEIPSEIGYVRFGLDDVVRKCTFFDDRLSLELFLTRLVPNWKKDQRQRLVVFLTSFLVLPKELLSMIGEYACEPVCKDFFSVSSLLKLGPVAPV